jgi:hypothetical protein
MRARKRAHTRTRTHPRAHTQRLQLHAAADLPANALALLAERRASMTTRLAGFVLLVRRYGSTARRQRDPRHLVEYAEYQQRHVELEQAAHAAGGADALREAHHRHARRVRAGGRAARD